MRRSSLLDMVRGSIGPLIGMGDSGDVGKDSGGVKESVGAVVGVGDSDSDGDGVVKGSGGMVERSGMEGGAVGSNLTPVANQPTTNASGTLTTNANNSDLDEYSAATHTSDTIHEERDSQMSTGGSSAEGVCTIEDSGRENSGATVACTVSPPIIHGSTEKSAPENVDDNVDPATVLCGDLSEDKRQILATKLVIEEDDIENGASGTCAQRQATNSGGESISRADVIVDDDVVVY